MSVFNYKMRVYYGETDKMSVAYYANYFVWYERARTEFLRKCGFPYFEIEEKGLFLPVVHAACKYISSVTYDDVICIETWISRLEGARVKFKYSVRKEDGSLVSTGETFHGFVDRQGKPCRLQKDVKIFIESVVESDREIPAK
jgi:acyl-CoA thioester hydrolase